MNGSVLAFFALGVELVVLGEASLEGDVVSFDGLVSVLGVVDSFDGDVSVLGVVVGVVVVPVVVVFGGGGVCV